MGLAEKRINTPLGEMVAVGDDDALYLLEFVSQSNIEKKIKCLREQKGAALIARHSSSTQSIEKELGLYFSNKLQTFTTPVQLMGTAFQKRVWDTLRQIPFGDTLSYKQLARCVANEKACRAVAQANGANLCAIIIPCHRIINSDGKLGGYAGGLERKKWLLEHEKRGLLR